jgi:hypothetical protein
MSEVAVERRAEAPAHKWPVKAWIVAALLFAFGVRLLATRDE